jgi:hypothetical protein
VEIFIEKGAVGARPRVHGEKLDQFRSARNAGVELSLSPIVSIMLWVLQPFEGYPLGAASTIILLR